MDSLGNQVAVPKKSSKKFLKIHRWTGFFLVAALGVVMLVMTAGGGGFLEVLIFSGGAFVLIATVGAWTLLGVILCLVNLVRGNKGLTLLDTLLLYAFTALGLWQALPFILPQSWLTFLYFFFQ